MRTNSDGTEENEVKISGELTRIIFKSDTGFLIGAFTGEAIMSERTRPVIGRVAVAIPDRCSRLKAIGNGQVPMVLGLAVDILSNGYG